MTKETSKRESDYGPGTQRYGYDRDFPAHTGRDVGDAVYLINYVFKGGAAPECGCVY